MDPVILAGWLLALEYRCWGFAELFTAALLGQDQRPMTEPG